MSRFLLVAFALGFLTTMASAAEPRKPATPILPVAAYGEAKPGKCTTCGDKQATIIPASYAVAGRPGTFGRQLQAQIWWEEHECAPDGCPTPVGCGNFWTEKKFLFGSCRQFFGTAGGTTGQHRGTVER